MLEALSADRSGMTRSGGRSVSSRVAPVKSVTETCSIVREESASSTVTDLPPLTVASQRAHVPVDMKAPPASSSGIVTPTAVGMFMTPESPLMKNASAGI